MSRSDKKAPTKVTLAPGLAVYQLARPAELVDAKGKRVASIKAVAKRDKLAAPKIKTITYEKTLSRRSVTRVVVELEAAPTGVVALVLADAKGTARSWGAVSGGTVEAFLSRDCLTLPNGTVETKAGEQVTLWFVDDAGRVSASTGAMAVAGKP
jgi:hypothetical protein